MGQRAVLVCGEAKALLEENSNLHLLLKSQGNAYTKKKKKKVFG